MKQQSSFLFAIGLVLLLSACSTASVISSWHNPEISSKITRPYIIGISRDDTKRRVFEDSARAKLAKHGVSAISSYSNLPASEENDKDMIERKALEKGADSILIVRVIDRRTETRVQPGRVTTQVTSPIHPDRPLTAPPFTPESHYYDYGSYYARSYQVIYEPPREIHFNVGTVEANLYDSGSDQLLWSGQFKVVEETPFDKLVNDFVDIMTGELKNKGLI